ncbi:MAG: cupin domain-containing protein [Thermoanaerobaculia bacterium]
MQSLNIPKKVEKPWGWELWIALSEHYAGKILHINAGESLSLQFHKIKDESIYVLKGLLILEIQENESLKKMELKEGECFRITPGTIHRFKSSSGCDIIEVSTPHLEDVVRLEDKYGRVK